MKVLVTGHTGFIGKRMLEFLKGNDEIQDVIGYSKSTGQDILNPEQVKDFVKESYLVLHFAAYAKPAESVKNPADAIKTNVEGCLNFLEACRQHNVPIIYPSSCEIYGDSESPIKEIDEIKPTNPYAASKAAADRLCYSYYKTYGLDVKIVRLFNPYGPGQQLNKIIPIFYFKAVRNEKIPVFGDGNDMRDYVFIEDIINGLWNSRKLNPGTTVNLATGRKTTTLDVAKIIIEMVGSNSDIEFSEYPKEFGGIYKQVGSYEKINKLIGWEPKVIFKEGVKNTINWLENLNKRG